MEHFCRNGHLKTEQTTQKDGRCILCIRVRNARYKEKKRIELGRYKRGTKPFCKHGHPLSGDNLRWKGGNRRCLTCHREQELKRNRRDGVQPRKPAIPLKLQRIKWEGARRARQKNQFVEYVDPIILYHRDNGICGICKQQVEVFEFEVDHIIALAKGGEHSYKNTQISHPTCNRRKYTKLHVA